MASGQTLELTALLGQVRKTSVPNYGDLEGKSPGINDRGEALVAQGLPPKSELTRLGATWSCMIPTGSAFTFVNAWPTTRAELVLLNTSTTKSLVMDSAWMVNITSQAAAQPYVLIAQIVRNHAAVTDDTAALIVGRSGQSGYNGVAQRDLAITTMVANRWELLANAAVSPMTTNLANGVLAEMYGGWIVPPLAAIGFAGVAGTAAGTAIIGVTWHEVTLPIG